MAKIDVVMPQMGESIAEGTLSKWLKKVGDAVKRDEPMFEISTDKVDAEIPAPSAGVLAEILVQEGQTVAVQTVVARLETDAAAAVAPTPAAKSPPPPGSTPPDRPSPRPPHPTSPSGPASAWCRDRWWSPGKATGSSPGRGSGSSPPITWSCRSASRRMCIP